MRRFFSESSGGTKVTSGGGAVVEVGRVRGTVGRVPPLLGASVVVVHCLQGHCSDIGRTKLDPWLIVRRPNSTNRGLLELYTEFFAISSYTFKDRN
jgi:hypothetical protein